MIVCQVLGTGENGLFFQFINTPYGNRLQNIIETFRDIIGLPNIASAIDGTTSLWQYDRAQDTFPCLQTFLIEKIS